MRRVAIAGAVLLLTLQATSAGTAVRSPVTVYKVVLRAVPRPGEELTGRTLQSAVAILSTRIDRLGGAPLILWSPRSRIVRVTVSGIRDPRRALRLAVRPGRVELYDLETALVPPSIDLRGLPVARSKPLRAGKRTALIRCGKAALVCPGVDEAPPRRTYFYLFKNNPAKGIPPITGADVDLARTRLDFDPLTGAPLVLVEFTKEGRRKLHELTRREAVRGQLLANRIGNADNALQHVAIVVDRELESFPSIDFRRYPDGIDAINGVQIAGIRSVREARDLSLLLQTGTLPVDFVQVGQPVVVR